MIRIGFDGLTHGLYVVGVNYVSRINAHCSVFQIVPLTLKFITGHILRVKGFKFRRKSETLSER